MPSTSNARAYRITGRLPGVMLAIAAAGALAACQPPALTQQVEARRLAADLHVQFTKAAEAANRAVMATGDNESAAAARESQEASEAVARDIERLRPLLDSLGYNDVSRPLQAFESRFTEFQRLDQELLPLAAEGTNLKAQRLSFGPARDAAAMFTQSVQAAAGRAGANTCGAETLALRATAAVREIQVLQAPHIAEADDVTMTRMEAEMAASESDARKSLAALRQTLGAAGAAQLDTATNALEQFISVNRELVTLSRRNSNVRSLALSLGQKRMVTAVADDQLRALDEALAAHAVQATR